MRQSLPSVASFRLAPRPLAAGIARPSDSAAPAAQGRPHILIATINRHIGDTGVQTHARALHDGLAAAGMACDIVTPFERPALWLPIFAMRKLLAPFNPTWSTRWYRHWHAAALRQALAARIAEVSISPSPGTLGEGRGEGLFSLPLKSPHPSPLPEYREREPDSYDSLGKKRCLPRLAVFAQCPVSARVALDVREHLGLDFPVAMVCHFNFSEAKEYRDKGELPNEKTYQAMLDFEQRVLGSVDRVIYVSSWAKRIVEQERGIKVRASSVIWNGIATESAAPISRADIGLDPGDLVLMNVGTLEKRKNQLGLIDLFAAVAQQYPDARLVLVGDGPYRAAIRERIDACGLASKVRMLGMRRDVPALLGAANLYVHYAAMENCPVVLIEAARAALPIAAVPGGGVPELLASLGGVALDSDDIAASVNRLRPLLADASTRRVTGQAARAAFERTFTRDAMVEAYLQAVSGGRRCDRDAG